MSILPPAGVAEDEPLLARDEAALADWLARMHDLQTALNKMERQAQRYQWSERAKAGIQALYAITNGLKGWGYCQMSAAQRRQYARYFDEH